MIRRNEDYKSGCIVTESSYTRAQYILTALGKESKVGIDKYTNTEQILESMLVKGL